MTGIELWLDLCVRLLVASVKQDVCRQQWQLGCASVQSETTQRLNADELWTRQAWGLWGACLSPALRGLAMHPLPISAAAQSGRRITNYKLPTSEMATLPHNVTILSWGESAGNTECSHTLTPVSSPSSLASGLRNTYALQAHGIGALDECPRHWC